MCEDYKSLHTLDISYQLLLNDIHTNLIEFNQTLNDYGLPIPTSIDYLITSNNSQKNGPPNHINLYDSNFCF